MVTTDQINCPVCEEPLPRNTELCPRDGWRISGGTLILGAITPPILAAFNAALEEARRGWAGRLLVPGAARPAGRSPDPALQLSAPGMSRLTCLARSPDGQTFATGGFDGVVRLWRRSQSQPSSALYGCTGRVTAVTFSEDGYQLFAGSGGRLGTNRVLRWHIRTGELVGPDIVAEQTITSLALRPGGAALAFASGGWGGLDNAVRVVDLRDGTLLATMELPRSQLISLDWSADGELVALGSGGWGSDYKVRLWDVSSGRILWLRPHGDNVAAVAFSPDQQLLASGSYDGTVRLWRVRDGKQEGEPWLAGSWVGSLAWHPDGRYLAAACYDQRVRVWQVGQPHPFRVLQGHGNRVTAVAWDATGSQLISAGWDANIFFWPMR